MNGTFVLRHKEYDAAILQLDTETGELLDLQVLSSKDMPVIGRTDLRSLSLWFDARAIPSGRSELENILSSAGCQTPEAYLVKNLALSLDDTYWLCPAELPDLSWDQVNLFSHAGERLVFHDGAGRAYYTSSDASLTGSLDKEAFYRDGAWYLRKFDGGKSGEGLQNINEAFASLLHQRQGFSEYVNYTLNFDSDGIAESCDCQYFTDSAHEFVPAYEVTGGEMKHYDGAAALHDFTEICAENGLSQQYVQDFLDYQFLTDFLLTNTDRHWNNFGILRDPETLQFLSMAPIFDSGTSMVYDDPFITNRLSLLRIETHGVEKLQENQLRLVHNPDLIDLTRLPSAAEAQAFYDSKGVSPERAAQIAHCYAMKADMLYELQHHIAVSISQELSYATEPPCVGLKPNPDYHSM